MNLINTNNKIMQFFLLALMLLATTSSEAGWYNPTMKWTTSTVSYSFGGGYIIDGGGTSSAVPGSWQPVIAAAFDEWASNCGLTFVQVADNNLNWDAAGAVGDIRITNHTFDGAGGTLGHGYYPPPNGVSAAGDIHFDPAENWYVGFGTPGLTQIDLFSVALHEIGHAIGLGHTTTAGAVMLPTYSPGSTNRTLSPEEISLIVPVYGADTATPEPATMMLLALCLAGLYFMAPPQTGPVDKKNDKKN